MCEASERFLFEVKTKQMKNWESILLSSQGTDFWSLYELLPKLFHFKRFYFNFNNLIGMTKEERFVEANILKDC